MASQAMDMIYDMETSDPDDAFTLAFLTSHPAVALRGVTVTPGSKDQIGVVKRILELTGHSSLPVGSRNPDRTKKSVSSFHYKMLGPVDEAQADGYGHQILADFLKNYPQGTVLTGAPLHNLWWLFKEHPEAIIEKWVGQGGFAGDNIVPPEHRLSKFEGKILCPTFNFNGHVKGAKLMLSTSQVKLRHLVSKNVCHGVVYNRDLHEKVALVKDKTPGLNLIYKGMEIYLQKRPEGKKFHDPLAASAAIDPSIITFEEVEVYRQKGQWGSKKASGTNTFISIAADEKRFVEILCQVE